MQDSVGLFGKAPRNPRAAARRNQEPGAVVRPASPMICSLCGGIIDVKALFVSAYVTAYDRAAGHPIAYGQLVICVHCWSRKMNAREMALKAAVAGRLRGLMSLSIADLEVALSEAQARAPKKEGTRVAKRKKA